MGIVKGKIDNLVFYELNGEQVVRRRPEYSKKALNTPLRRKQNCLMTMINQHLSFHRNTINQTFDRQGNKTQRNMYYSLNAKALNEALSHLAMGYAIEKDVLSCRNISLIEKAIEDYASTHPDSIVIVNKEGIEPQTLRGAWPDHIKMMNTKSKAITIIPCLEVQPKVDVEMHVQYEKK